MFIRAWRELPTSQTFCSTAEMLSCCLYLTAVPACPVAHTGTDRSGFWGVLPSQVWLSPPKPCSSLPSCQRAQGIRSIPCCPSRHCHSPGWFPIPRVRCSTARGCPLFPFSDLLGTESLGIEKCFKSSPSLYSEQRGNLAGHDPSECPGYFVLTKFPRRRSPWEWGVWI